MERLAMQTLRDVLRRLAPMAAFVLAEAAFPFPGWAQSRAVVE